MLSQYSGVDQTPNTHLKRRRHPGPGDLDLPFVHVARTWKTFPAKSFQC